MHAAMSFISLLFRGETARSQMSYCLMQQGACLGWHVISGRDLQAGDVHPNSKSNIERERAIE